MGKFSVLMLFMVLWMYLYEDAQGLAFPSDNMEDEAAQLDETSKRDEDEITQLREQVVELQRAVTELTRSFSSLERIAKSPSLIEKLLAFDDPDTSRDSPKLRVERDVDSETPPTTSSPSLSDDQHSHLSPFRPQMWPMPGQCFMCPAGVPGPRGPPGPQGIAGRDGRDGRDAPTKTQVSDDETILDETSPATPSGCCNTSQSGVVYIRWGNSACPENAELIYKGTVGGAMYTHSGSGANYLCMPHEPIYDEIEAGAQDYRALLYSSEYESNSDLGGTTDDHTPTCAVCKAPSGYTTKLMIPARNVCPSSEWRLEYAGYLMAEKYNTKRSDFVCVDRQREREPGTQGNENGALLFMVEGRCLDGGGLPCGPYVDGNELTCAVCTI